MTLHNTTELVKKGLKITSIVGGTVITGIIVFRIGLVVKERLFPPPPPPFETKYGKLAKIPFGEPALQEDFSYTLDTVTGTLPVFPDRANVYEVTHPLPSLLHADQAKRKASRIGFISENAGTDVYKVLSPTEFEWQAEEKAIKKTFTLNIETSDFTYKTNYLQRPVIQYARYDESGAKSAAIGFLQVIDQPTDLDPTIGKVQMFGVRSGTLIPATTFSKTQVFRVDIYQKALEEIPIVYPRYPYSTMNFIVNAQGEGVGDVIEGNYFHQDIKIDDFANYPIKTAEEAFAELEAGKAFVSNYYGTRKTVSITDVYLGYFLSDKQQDYVLPVVVFEGDGGYYGFISAVRDEWIEQ